MSNEEKKPFVLDSLPEHERPLGRIIADADGPRYSPLRSLDEARAVSDGVVILQGDDGGQIYVVCPASEITCSAEALDALLRDLDQIAWPDNDPSMARIYYERLAQGAGICGGMGGGLVADGRWIHDQFVKMKLSGPIREVLRGARTRIK